MNTKALKKITITVLKGGEWHAGYRGLNAYGNTSYSAIGVLISSHPGKFGIEIKSKTEKHIMAMENRRVSGVKG